VIIRLGGLSAKKREEEGIPNRSPSGQKKKLEQERGGGEEKHPLNVPARGM